MTLPRALTAMLAGLLLVLSWGRPAQAQRSGQQIEALEGVGVDQKLGETIPADLTFTDAEGREVKLSRYFDGTRPVMLTLVYHDCPMLCGLVLQRLTRQTLTDMRWTPGEQFELVTVSFNPREGPELAREKKEAYLGTLGTPEAAAGWHFLTGSKEQIDRLTDAVGFRYRWIEEKRQYAHPAVTMFLSGEGKITRYLFGMGPAAGDARKALVEASDGQVGNVADQIALRCFQYDPDSNSYVADAFNIMRLGSLLFAVFVGVALFFFWRRERDDLDAAQAEAAQAASGWEAT